MAFIEPAYSKNDVKQAGKILMLENPSRDQRMFAEEVLANWRAAHGYPINTFQATLRAKLNKIDKNALVAQRLKRTPSIILKLKRFPTMGLAQMQDIGGLRAVLPTISAVHKLEFSYKNSRFKHRLSSSKDYIKFPKSDGYRGIHLIYKYSNPIAPAYNDLSLELQIRTRLQHAWATSVETMGTFLGQALKSGEGEQKWRHFFILASAAIARHEKCAGIPEYQNLTENQIREKLRSAEKNLNVLDKLNTFAIAADKIVTVKGQGVYHLIILDSSERKVTIKPFPATKLKEANEEYMNIESSSGSGGKVLEAVLVSAGPVDQLKKAYPNYFLDTQVFLKHIRKFLN